MVESQEDEVNLPPDLSPEMLLSLENLPPDLLYEYDYLDDFEGPFWRDNGAVDIISKSLSEIKGILTQMIDEGRIVKAFYAEYPSFKKLQAFYYEYPPSVYPVPREEQAAYTEYVAEEEMFWEISGRFTHLEHDLACCARTAILMAAIDLEAGINKFCFYNLGEEATNAIERLTPAEKLTVIHKVLDLGDFKGTSQYESVIALAKWRNAFAHGKCPDMPARSLRENHLSEPKNLRGSGEVVNEVLKLLRHYIVVHSHLNKISQHPSTSGEGYNFSYYIKPLLRDVQAFRFKDEFTIENSNI